MSTISYTSGQLEQKQRLLDEMNRAVLALQADALGVRARLGISDEDLRASRGRADALVRAVADVIAGRSADAAVTAVAARINETTRPPQEWLEDLEALHRALAGDVRLAPAQLALLGELLQMFDREFTEDLYRIYGRL